MSGWVLKSSRLLVDSAWLRVFQNAYNLPGGQVIDDYYIIERQPFVLVVAGDDENVILVRKRSTKHVFRRGCRVAMLRG